MPSLTTHNTPALRFPGYTGVWEQQKLGDIGKTYTGLSGKSKTDFGHGKAHFVTYMNVYSHPVADINQVDSCEIDSKQHEVQYGDVFFTTSSETPDEVGMSSVWLGNTENTYLNSFCFGYRPDQQMDPYFTAHILRSPTLREQFILLAQGISRYNISKNKAMDIKLSLPSLSEQRKIGSFFNRLDGLINLHQRQTQKLTELKQGLLQNMFPREGESVPRLRFPGFTTTWKQQKVEELMDVTSVKRIHQSDWTTFGVPFLRARDIVARSKHEKITDPLFISQEKYDEYSAISGKVKLGDLLVTGVGTIGIPLLITDDKPIYFKDGNIIWFKNTNIDGYFLYYAFCQKKVQSFINQAAGKGTVATYTITTAKSTPLVLPSSRNEQRKIGSFFHKLDDLINLHEQYTMKLIHLKKGLLQAMFPQD